MIECVVGEMCVRRAIQVRPIPIAESGIRSVILQQTRKMTAKYTITSAWTISWILDNIKLDQKKFGEIIIIVIRLLLLFNDNLPRWLHVEAKHRSKVYSSRRFTSVISSDSELQTITMKKWLYQNMKFQLFQFHNSISFNLLRKAYSTHSPNEAWIVIANLTCVQGYAI